MVAPRAPVNRSVFGGELIGGRSGPHAAAHAGIIDVAFGVPVAWQTQQTVRECSAVKPVRSIRRVNGIRPRPSQRCASKIAGDIGGCRYVKAVGSPYVYQESMIGQNGPIDVRAHGVRGALDMGVFQHNAVGA